MRIAQGLVLAGMLAFGCRQRTYNAAETESASSSAYICELYDKAEDVPGGDVPALVLYSDTNDAAVAEAACRARVDRRKYIDFRLIWTDESKLPANWREKNLLKDAPPPAAVTPRPTAGPADSSAYVCELFDKPEGVPGGDIPAQILYSDTDDVEKAKTACRGRVDRTRFVDYRLRWVKESELPADWKDKDLLKP